MIMLSGYMQVEVDGAAHTLGPGDALRYRQFEAARFVTAKGQGARYLLCVLAR